MDKPKFVANKNATLGVGGMRFYPIMIDHMNERTPVVLVRQNVDQPQFTENLINALLEFMNGLLDEDVPFADEDPVQDGVLAWKDVDGAYLRAPHPTAEQAAYYIRPSGAGGGFMAEIVDGKTKDRRTLGTNYGSIPIAKEACEAQYKASIA